MQWEDSAEKMVLIGNSEIMRLINSSPDLASSKQKLVITWRSPGLKNLMKPRFSYYELPVAYRLK